MRAEYAQREELIQDGKRIGEVESFKYLGTMISNTGSLELSLVKVEIGKSEKGQAE